MAEGPFSENGKPNFFSSAGEEWRILGEGFTAGLLLFSWGRFFQSPFSILREGHKGVSHLSPQRSYPIGSSFSSFSILRPPRRCDPYCKAEASMVDHVHLNAHTVVTLRAPTPQPTSPPDSKSPASGCGQPGSMGQSLKSAPVG